MKKVFLPVLLAILRLLLWFRYKVTYKGLDEVKKALEGCPMGALFLPNHPAIFVDPLIVNIPLIKDFAVRPLIVEYMYYQPAFHSAVCAIGALPIPNFATGINPIKLKRAERTLEAIQEGLRGGDSFLIYPAGTTKHQAKEVLGGAFGVYQLASEVPNLPIVLVRITGLWGSSFSRAATGGEAIDTRKALKHGFWTILKNLIFFVPRRNCLVEFEMAPAALPRTGSKVEFNRFLEDWYNKPFPDAGEPLSLVSYAFWKSELLQIAPPKREKLDLSAVPQEIKDRVRAKVAELAKVAPDRVLPDLKLVEDLGLDSLDLAELLAFMESQFDVPTAAPQDLVTVGQLFLLASGAFGRKELAELTFNLKEWNRPKRANRVSMPKGATIPEVFLRAADLHSREVACADAMRGVMSYFALKKRALLLSEKVAKLPGDRIGILLPASSTAQVLILACQMAGKTPVMINWTVGGKHLETVVSVAEIKVVVSSWTFLDALGTVDISHIEPLLFVLEEMRLEISLWDMLKAHLRAYQSADSILKQLPPLEADTEAVVLFTSGTESMPKGVPLTHANILSDLRAAIKEVHLYESDRLLAMLPPFHSFGFTVTGLLPLLVGMKAVYYPNPTDSKRLIKAIPRWGINVLCSAPTFLKNMMQVAKDEKFAGVRLIISGAEKATDELVSQVKRTFPKALFVEGYGITECSPVLTANATGDRKLGVGKPLEGIEIKIVDIEKLDPEKRDVEKADLETADFEKRETSKSDSENQDFEKQDFEKPRGEVGMVLAAGPNVFSGYLKPRWPPLPLSGPATFGLNSPFVELDGKRWYQTGDLGKLDDAGNLTIQGRLKRFIKVGGEMISLAAIEEAVSQQTHQEPTQVAIMSTTDPIGKVCLVLFTVRPLEVQEVNQMLRKSGFGNIVKIDSIVRLDALPQTATGKIAYRQLDTMVNEKVKLK